MIARLLCWLPLFMVAVPSDVFADQPNVLFIAIDDLNDWVGCLDGHPQALTPNIDRLAQRGVLFTNAHCVAPACNPSRAAVFSGRMPWKTDVWSNKSRKLDAEKSGQPVLPLVMKKAGYTTLGTGKLLHSGKSNKNLYDQSFNPEQRWSPFEKKQVEYTAEELPTKATDRPRHQTELNGEQIVLPLNGMPSDRRPDRVDGESFDWGPLDVPDSAMGDAQITQWAIDRMNEGFDGKPFFLGVGYYRPHIPLFAPASYFERFDGQEVQLPKHSKSDLDDLSETAKQWAVEPITAGAHATVLKYNQWQEAVKAYLACVTFVDHQVGKLIDALDAGDFGENTLIVLWSDHGWHLGEKQHWGKWTPWERSTRVPLIIAPPKNQSDLFRCEGKRCASPVSLIDLFPTVVDLCKVTKPSGLDGRSLAPQLFDPSKATGRTVATLFDKGNVSLRNGAMRYIKYADGTEELYDSVRDPNEWQNIVADAAHETELKQFRIRASSLK